MIAHPKRRAVALNTYAVPVKYIAFSGLPDMAETARAHCADLEQADGWAGADMTTTLHRARAGDLPRVALSDALLSKVEDLLDLATLRAVTIPTVAGGAPCVPAYLAGHPMAMRARKRVASDRGEIVLAVDGYTPNDVALNTIARRGAAVLALARALAMFRPVKVLSYALSGTASGAFAYTLPLDSAPLDLARAAWILGAPEFTRQMRLPIQAAALGSMRTGPVPVAPRRFLCDVLGIADQSLIIAPGFGDGDTLESDAKAVEWVRARLDTMIDAP